MPFRNQYIDQVLAHPDMLFGAEGREFSATEQERLLARLAKSKRIFIEMGSGSGGHLIELAKQNPEVLCCGIEKRYKRAVRTAEKAAVASLNNLIVVRADLSNMAVIFQAKTIDRVYVNFPDPWEKKRWVKKRMLSEESLSVIAELLNDTGILRYKTDHQGYFTDTLEIINTGSLFEITKQSRDLFNSSFASDNITSEFEQLFLSQGLKICFLEATKKLHS